MDRKQSQYFRYQVLDSDHRFPPELSKCRLHQKAQKIGRDDPNDDRCCECCGFQVSSVPFSLLCDIKELSDYGIGLCQFLYFLRFMIQMVTIICLINSFIIWRTIVGDHCTKITSNYQTNDKEIEPANCIYLRFTLFNISSDDLWKEYMFVSNILISVVLVWGLKYYNKRNRLLVRRIDQQTESPSDYTVIVRKVDTNINEQQVQDQVEQMMKDWDVKLKSDKYVANVLLVHKINDFIELYEKRQILIKAKLQNKQQTGWLSSLFSKQQTISAIDDQLSQLEDKQNLMLKHHKLQQTNVVFVTFQYQEYAQKFIRYSKNIQFQSQSNSNKQCQQSQQPLLNNTLSKIKANRADEPEDIVWENIGIDGKIKRKQRRKTIINTILLLTILFLVLLGLYYLNEQLVNYNHVYRAEMQYLISALICFVNTILFWELQKYTEQEKRKSRSKYNSQLIAKLSIAMFINTGLIIILVKKILNLKEEQKGGLIESVSYVLISNAILPPLMGLFDIWYLYKLIQRKTVNDEMGQKEANEIYEGPSMDLAYKYCIILKDIGMTLLFVNLIPLSIYILWFNLVLKYMVEKYLILRRYKRPDRMNQDLNIKATQYMQTMVLVLGIGGVLWIDYYQIVVIVIGIVWIFQSQNEANNQAVVNNTSYEQAKHNFSNEYSTMYPLSKQPKLTHCSRPKSNKKMLLHLHRSVLNKYQYVNMVNNYKQQNQSL